MECIAGEEDESRIRAAGDAGESNDISQAVLREMGLVRTG